MAVVQSPPLLCRPQQLRSPSLQLKNDVDEQREGHVAKVLAAARVLSSGLHFSGLLASLAGILLFPFIPVRTGTHDRGIS